MLVPKVTVFLALSQVSGALIVALEPAPRFPFLGGVRKGAGGAIAIMSDEAFSTGDADEASPPTGEAAFFPRFFFFFFWEEGDASCLRERRDRTPDRDQKRERSQSTREPLTRKQLGKEGAVKSDAVRLRVVGQTGGGGAVLRGTRELHRDRCSYSTREPLPRQQLGKKRGPP